MLHTSRIARRAGAGAVTLLALAAGPASAAVTETPISFAVKNTNTTSLPCQADGKDYTMRGTLVAPEGATPPAVTLHLHAVTWTRDYFRLPGAPKSYDFAAQLAERGHASVVVDRLGYGASDKPPGMEMCFGSTADVAHQAVNALREGAYSPESGEPAKFEQVFISGSSVGGLTSNLVASEYANVDGVINQSWGDLTATPYAGAELIDVTERCVAGGDEGAPPSYAAFAKDTQATFYYNSATPEVRAVVPTSRPDPCGELMSLPLAIQADTARRAEIEVPVLVSFGTADAVFGPHPLALEQTAARYTGSSKVTKVAVPDASHYPLVEADHAVLTDAVAAWLDENTKAAAGGGSGGGGQGGNPGAGSGGGGQGGGPGGSKRCQRKQAVRIRVRKGTRRVVVRSRGKAVRRVKVRGRARRGRAKVRVSLRGTKGRRVRIVMKKGKQVRGTKRVRACRR